MKKSPMQKSRPNPFDLDQRHADILAKFTQALSQSRFWQLLPKGEASKASGWFDAQTGLVYPPPAQLRAFLDRHPFALLLPLQSQQVLATLHSKTKLLWNNETSHQGYNLAGGKQLVQQGRWAGLEGWRLPNKKMLQGFACAPGNPHRKGKAYLLARAKPAGAAPAPQGQGQALGKLFGAIGEGAEYHRWLTSGGGCDVGSGCWVVSLDSGAAVFACHARWQAAEDASILADILTFGWRLLGPNENVFRPAPDPRWQALSPEALLQVLAKEGWQLRACNSDIGLDPGHFAFIVQLADLDYTPCRLPRLDGSQLTDPSKGLWEAWGADAAEQKRHGIVARDPQRDLQRRAVAIDFGTSSTVVAMDTAHGTGELLRIGVRDFYQPVQAQHFENPTVLECLDFTAFQAAWTARAYRPALDWNDMRAAHEAQTSFRDNPGDTAILASILPKLKQWALRSQGNRIQFTDRQGREIDLEPHTERNPVRGQPLAVHGNDPFDPVELYAWYLGMAINQRARGIFLQYYLSFPVKYPREVKDRVLASFRRGLQRSLPQSLIEHYPHVLNEFEVNNLASEPAAYAAAALPHLGLEPTDSGTPYAVFDFGGGTTDFDFGLLRWANAAEEKQGYERVFEHLASSGDNFLGGENLIEHLVYASFQHNLDTLRQQRIQFTLPIDAQPFAGSEAFLAKTQAAQTNTVMLAAKLRPFLEGASPDLPTQLKLDLIDANGAKKLCELSLDKSALDKLLAGRIYTGVVAFLAELARLQPELPDGTPIHVLLAGNGSRSRHVTALFLGERWAELKTQAFGSTVPEIVVHKPLPIDDNAPHKPTTKTGVALGLLRLAPGKNTLLIDHVYTRHDGQAPFAWFIGRLRRDRFQPLISPGANYGEWHELGPLQQGVFNLYASTSPRASSGLAVGDPELKMQRHDFPAASSGALLFARATAPHTLELATGQRVADLQHSPIQSIALEQ